MMDFEVATLPQCMKGMKLPFYTKRVHQFIIKKLIWLIS